MTMHVPLLTPERPLATAERAVADTIAACEARGITVPLQRILVRQAFREAYEQASLRFGVEHQPYPLTGNYLPAALR